MKAEGREIEENKLKKEGNIHTEKERRKQKDRECKLEKD
jgi:hypothetical protein